MTDRNLEDSIFQLQKLNTEDGVKQLVEEAAHLFAAGRHSEAGALMEKAEALMAARAGKPALAGGSSPNPLRPERPKAEVRPKVDEQAMANMATRLADGLSKILTGAFEELERHVVGESRKISNSLEQQLDRLQATVNSLQQLQAKFEYLSEAVSEVRSSSAAMGQKQEQLLASVTTLDQTSSRHNKEIGTLREESTALRAEGKDYATVVAHQMDALSARLGLHQEELTGVKSTVAEVSRKVAGFIERMDRQADAIRAITDSQVRRAAALDEMLGVLTRLKEPAETAVAAAAGHL
ncbi:MAG: hypothetical protein LAP39_03835 [Acidobacteriia bacterium]|nr:hypothetical protein [Terriglobia bacterium]